MHSLKIGFEEMPTVVLNGREGGFVDGRAEIDFDRDGFWEVSGIYLELIEGTTQRKLTNLDPRDDAALYCRLADLIEARCANDITDAIDDYWAREEDQIADARHEMRVA